MSSSSRMKPYHRKSMSRGWLESLILRNSTRKVSITSFGKREKQYSTIEQEKSSSSVDSPENMSWMVDSLESEKLPHIRKRNH